MLRPTLLVLVAHWLVLVGARNCSLQSIREDEIVEWRPAGYYRGTWSIISTCLTTIFACTWSIQHLNVPAKGEGAWRKLKRKAKWMLITVLFPELILIHAVLEFHMAWSALLSMADHEKPVHWPWWFRKRPFAWLRYCRRYLEKTKGSYRRQAVADYQPWTLYHCYFANMGGFLYNKDNKLFLLTAQRLAASECQWPVIKEDDIKDRSKQDWLAKIFAAFQILQLILSLITRSIQGLAFSQLETVMLSFAVCGVLIYYVNIYKPQNIDQAEPFNVDVSLSSGLSPIPPSPNPKTALHCDETGLLSADRTYDSLWAIMLNKGNTSTVTGSADSPPRIPNDNIPLYKGNNEAHPAVYFLALASGLFGALHAIAWNFHFPTQDEKLLWHIAIVVSAASPIVGLLAIPFTQLTTSAGDPEVFIENCLRLLKEFSWHHGPDNNNSQTVRQSIQEVVASLERVLDNIVLHQDSQPRAYKEIFQVQHGSSPLAEANNYLCSQSWFSGLEDETPSDLRENDEFVQNFDRLSRVLKGYAGKKLSDAAWTDQWPRKPLLHPVVNSLILYGTCFLYCASRLIILAVAVSSMRKMPGSVYFETSWTPYFPRFGASG